MFRLLRNLVGRIGHGEHACRKEERGLKEEKRDEGTEIVESYIIMPVILFEDNDLIDPLVMTSAPRDNSQMVGKQILTQDGSTVLSSKINFFPLESFQSCSEPAAGRRWREWRGTNACTFQLHLEEIICSICESLEKNSSTCIS